MENIGLTIKELYDFHLKVSCDLFDLHPSFKLEDGEKKPISDIHKSSYLTIVLEELDTELIYKASSSTGIFRYRMNPVYKDKISNLSSERVFEKLSSIDYFKEAEKAFTKAEVNYWSGDIEFVVKNQSKRSKRKTLNFERLNADTEARIEGIEFNKQRYDEIKLRFYAYSERT